MVLLFSNIIRRKGQEYKRTFLFLNNSSEKDHYVDVEILIDKTEMESRRQLLILFLLIIIIVHWLREFIE